MRRTLLVFAAALAIASAAPAQGVGSPAPDFTLETWFNAGPEKSLADFAGKVVLVEIWSTG